MRILVETTVTLADQGTKVRRVEIETDGQEAASRVLDPVFVVRGLLEAMDGKEELPK